MVLLNQYFAVLLEAHLVYLLLIKVPLPWHDFILEDTSVRLLDFHKQLKAYTSLTDFAL